MVQLLAKTEPKTANAVNPTAKTNAMVILAVQFLNKVRFSLVF